MAIRPSILLGAAYLLVSVDFLLTRWGVAQGEITEWNPLLAWAMQCSASTWLVLLLLAMGTVFVYRSLNQLGRRVLWVVYVVSALIIVSRLAVLLAHWHGLRQL